MSKRVLSVGQCDPDNGAISRMLTRGFDVEFMTADQAEDALISLRNGPIDLVLVNRKLDCDNSDGLEVIRQIKADTALKNTPCMMVTNLAEHQDAAVAAGAERGFGKAELKAPETHERLRPFLQ